jgi:hypothetical protein
MNVITELICGIESDVPINFVKFGDGEIYAMSGASGCNCDGDNYTTFLKNRLCDSLNYFVKIPNFYIGKWGVDSIRAIIKTITEDIKWAEYHSLIFIGDNCDHSKSRLLNAIRDSRRKKIVICNRLLEKTKLLFNTTDIIFVNFNNWFDSDFSKVLCQAIQLIGKEDGDHIIITCAGMGSKVLLAELHKIYPKNIYLDYGSALDKLCTKRETRGWGYSYEYLIDLCKDFLPDDWNDPKYDHIYKEAKECIGLHI